MSYHVKARQASRKDIKYIFISGGVISSVGKGVTSASLALLLEARGYKVAPVKCDAYLNVDAGTIRPQEHGEVFVLDDGMECDQDLGNYERFLNRSLTKSNYVTNGQIYQRLIEKERNFEFDGEDVEIIPHVPEEIIRRLETAGEEQNADVVICEIGGTVGEYQNILFIEASRIMKYRDARSVVHVHVGYLPIPPSIGEMKSKPVQNSIRQLNASGIQPDFLVARSSESIDDRRKQTLAWICNLKPDHIIAAPDASSIYEVPLNFEKQSFGELLVKELGLKVKKPNIESWKKFNSARTRSVKSKVVDIAVVGKYYETGDFKLADVYVSVVEALKSAAWTSGCNVKLHWVSSIDVEKQGASKVLSKYDGIVVPGGFGSRGTEGMIETIQYARTKNIPFLGLCYGLQMAVIEYARNVLKLDAHTTEVDPSSPHPVIHIMPDQEKLLLKKQYGGTMRLGGWPCKLDPKSKAFSAYKKSGWVKSERSATILERHRHRYEVNNVYREQLSKAGFKFSGYSPDGLLVEIIELPKHKFFMASQFHPEFLARPLSPHPLFLAFIKSIK